MKVEIKVLPPAKGFYTHNYTKPSNSCGYEGPPVIDEQLLPKYATPGSAAMDLICIEDITLSPGETKMIHTGLSIWLGVKWRDVAALILPRSGLGHKGLILGNGTGLIDEDYQGELMVSAWNRNKKGFIDRGDGCSRETGMIELKVGDRFAQLVIVPVIKAQWDLVEEFSTTTERGQGGFGSSGV